MRFRDCAKGYYRDILRATVQSLKDVGAWDTLEGVVVEDCKGLGYEEALDAVGKEKLLFL